MKYIIFFLMGMVALTSCQKDEPMSEQNDPPSDPPKLEVVWRTSLYDGPKNARSFRPILFEDLVIASSDEVGQGDIEKIFAFNKWTGDTVWVWDDYFSPQNGEEFGRHIVESEGDVLFFSSTHALYAVDKRDGSTIWRELIFEDNQDDGLRLVNRRFDILNGKAYFDIRWGTTPDIDSAYFMEYDIGSGRSREVLRFHKKGIHGPALAKPAGFVNEDGDEMMLIQCHYLRTEYPVNAYPAMYCYNLTQDSLVWQIDSVDSYDAGSPIGPAIYGDQAIVFGTWTIFSFDLKTGEENWRWYVPESGGFSFADWDIHDGVMYFKTNQGDLTALEIEGGTPVYFKDNSDLGGYCLGVQYHKSKLLWASKWLYMADAPTGELIERFTAPSETEDGKNGYFSSGLIDRVNDLYYVCDGHDLICYKIKE